MTEDRKLDHLILANEAQVSCESIDLRFNYEPLLSAHPCDYRPSGENSALNIKFGEWQLKAPIWISSMTGGTGKASFINKNLARVAEEFGLGMSLGSCRPLLDSDDYFADFNMKPYMPTTPLLANFGLAQIEKALLCDKRLDKLFSVVERLKVDGIVIHINPMQEWLQPEGDRFINKPLDVLKEFIERVSLPLMVKEVGQGIGPKSLEALMKLPLTAIEFGAFGGTNFSKLEIMRSKTEQIISQSELSMIGHSAKQMVEIINNIKKRSPQVKMVNNFIISGGIKSFLDGFYLCKKLDACAIYGQAKTILDHASKDYDTLEKYIGGQIKGLEFATSYLTIR